jgi:hypothetical protein
MKALSIKQPWLNLILAREKTIEVRGKNTSYRGDLLLCASKTPALNKGGMDEMEEDLGLPYHFGHALCVAKLTDARQLKPGDEEAAFLDAIDPSMFGWLLKDIRLVAPFPVKGELGFYEVDDALINASPFAAGDCVRVLDDVQNDELDIDLAGWQGRIVEIVVTDEYGWLYGFLPDSHSIPEIPLAHIKSCVAEQEGWNTFWLKAEELKRVEPHDSMESTEAAISKIMEQNPQLFPEEAE